MHLTDRARRLLALYGCTYKSIMFGDAQGTWMIRAVDEKGGVVLVQCEIPDTGITSMKKVLAFIEVLKKEKAKIGLYVSGGKFEDIPTPKMLAPADLDIELIDLEKLKKLLKPSE